MKKKIIFAATAVFMAAAVSVFTYISSERDAMDELFSANVEALANTESGFGRMCVPNAGFGEKPYIICSTCRQSTTTIYSYSFCDL